VAPPTPTPYTATYTYSLPAPPACTPPCLPTTPGRPSPTGRHPGSPAPPTPLGGGGECLPHCPTHTHPHTHTHHTPHIAVVTLYGELHTYTHTRRFEGPCTPHIPAGHLPTGGGRAGGNLHTPRNLHLHREEDLYPDLPTHTRQAYTHSLPTRVPTLPHPTCLPPHLHLHWTGSLPCAGSCPAPPYLHLPAYLDHPPPTHPLPPHPPTEGVPTTHSP